MKNKTITIILSILILGSVGDNIYQTITKQQIQSELNSVSARISTLQNNVNNQKSELDSIQSEIDTALSDIDNKQNEINTAQADLEKAENDLADILVQQKSTTVPETPASTESSAPVVKEETPVTKPSTPSVKEEETPVTQPSTSNEPTVSPDGIITSPSGTQYTSDGGIIIDGKVYNEGDVLPGGMIHGGFDPNH